jgi:hypothetical protein
LQDCSLFFPDITYFLNLKRSDPTENDSVEGLRPNARGPGLVTFGVSILCVMLCPALFSLLVRVVSVKITRILTAAGSCYGVLQQQ